MSYAGATRQRALFGTNWQTVLDQVAPLVLSTDPRHQDRPCGGYVPLFREWIFGFSKSCALTR